MSRYLKILVTILALGAALILVVAAVGIGGYYYVAPSLPQAEELRNVKIQIPLQVFSRDGRLISEFGEIKRTPVAYEDIPPLLVKAVLAAEDEHFFEHAGVDYRGVLRGIVNEIIPSGRNVGGSTITQQITRTLNVFSRAGLSSGVQRFVQKFREWILAFRIEGEFTKQEILDLYMNTSFFGQRSYGVVTAARTYFGKDLGELSIAEIALLAGIPNRPTDFNPVASVERATARRAYVLRRMNETGAITSAEYQAALAEPVLGRHYGTETQVDAPYVAEMVRAEMYRKFGPAAQTAGFKVTTTIDSRLQRAANRAMHKTLNDYDERHGYRGALAHVDLPPGAAESAAPAAAELRALLDDHPNVVDYESAIVLAVEPERARVFFSDRGEQTIDFAAASWAAPFINDDTVGTKPTSMQEVLKPGDVVRFRHDAAGNWRLAQIPEVEGAFASVDPQDGSVVALAGGFDFYLSNYNRATQAKRQPGSSFKPFVYSAALQNGFTAATIVNDSPVEGEYQAELERVWRPENYGGKYFGFVSLRFALQHSLNSVSIRITKAMGLPTAVRYVRKFGFDDTAIPNNLSIALGAGGVAPLDLVTGYATFANGGYRVEHHFIERIADANGDVLYDADPAFVCADCGLPTAAASAVGTDAACSKPPPPPAGPKPESAALISDVTQLFAPMRVAPQIITPQNAYLMTDLMQDVARIGTGAGAYKALKRNDIAGKTGTTNEGHDTWFVGFNSDVVAAAWVGFDQDRSLGGAEQGGFTALPMWVDYMKETLANEPEHTLARPLGIVEYRINPTTGLIASDATRDTVFEKFDIDNVPQREPDNGFVGSDPTTPSAPAQAPIFN